MAYEWEKKLVQKAYSAMDSCIISKPVQIEKTILDQAYLYCESIAKKHSKTFHLASSLLPFEKRRSARALYAFCRISDDIIDRPNENYKLRLDEWKKRSISDDLYQDDPITIAWADTKFKFKIPSKYAEQLIDGVEMDLKLKRYDTFEELAEYCYGVASTVGLMVMHIIGFSDNSAINYAIRLGVALQLTNILRDIREDYMAGRVYLPQKELSDFGLEEKNIAESIIDNRWKAFMRFQIERNRILYKGSLPGIELLDPDGRFAIATSAELYRAILDDIEAHDYNVFNRRAFVSNWNKFKKLPGIWWRTKTHAYSKISD
ncbi:MAG: phytoene/squalene synthase family protein [bacterium]